MRLKAFSILLAGIIYALLLIFSACNNGGSNTEDDDDGDNNVPTTDYYYVVAVNLTAIADNDFGVSGNAIASDLNYGEVFYPLDGFEVAGGTDLEYQFFQDGNLLTSMTTTSKYEHQTFYAVGEGTNYNIFNTADSYSTPAAGKAKVRFINLCPDIASLYVEFGGTVVSDREYEGNVSDPLSGTYYSFQEVPAGQFSFTAKNTANNSDLSLGHHTLDEGLAYTFFFYQTVGTQNVNNNFVVHD